MLDFDKMLADLVVTGSLHSAHVYARVDHLAAVEEAVIETARVVEHKRTACGKCGGAGRIQAYRHRANGVCYSCGGSGRRVA